MTASDTICDLSSEENFIHTKHGYCYYALGENPIIYGLYVEPEYRRQGHARDFLRYSIYAIRATGYAGEIKIEAAPREGSVDLPSLVCFYQAMGLTVIQAGETP
jgi:GNAT superfamily N-acetyltransferase